MADERAWDEGLAYPYCARCRKSVDECETLVSAVHEAVEVVATCHGQTERRSVTRAEALAPGFQVMVFR